MSSISFSSKMNASTSRTALRSIKAIADSSLARQDFCCHAARLAAIRHDIRRSSRHRTFATYNALRAVAAPAAKPASTSASTTARPTATSSTAGTQGNSGHYGANASKPVAKSNSQPPADLTQGLKDGSSLPPAPDTTPSQEQVDWTRSFHGLSTTPFSPEASKILLEPIPAEDIEIKPDGIVYLPEIKYRRILNRAFGPGAWGLAPRGETLITGRSVTREYGLVVHGRLVSIARGEQQYFDPEGIPTATEGCKSNALMRCCKDLGIASELWDPVFIRGFMAKHAREVWVEHVTTKKKRKITVKKGIEGGGVIYPYKESKA